MGTAMGTVFAANKYKVVFWDIESEVLVGINRKHRNPRSLSNVKLDAAISGEGDIEKAVANADVLVFSVASRAVREVAEGVRDSLARNCVIISVSKGIEAGSLKTIHDVIRDVLGARFNHQITVFSGPTLASGIAGHSPTAAMLASEKSNAYSRRAYEALSCKWLRIYETRDVIGVSLAGVAKNALAVAAGMMVGFEMSMNTYGWVMVEGFREIARLVWKMGGQEQTMYGLAGFGDAITTWTAEESRNRTFGAYLGKGKTVTRAREAVGQTVEGIDAIESLYKLALKEKLNLPVLKALYEIVSLKKKADKVFNEMIQGL